MDGSVHRQGMLMIENKETNNTKDARINLEQGHHLENRLEKDRRRKPSKGFTYISSVGWIDRREKLRRKNDPYNF
jgi:hypothetical protein